jgi:hypothetical protein
MSNVSLYLILMYCMILVNMFPLFLQRNKLWKIVQMYLALHGHVSEFRCR